jgi:hypothetical protein
MQWALLLTLSTLLVGAAEGLRLPAALLLGPMIAAIIVGASEATVRVAPRPFIAAQAVVGCMIGQSIPLTVLTELLADWPLFLAGVVLVIVAACLLGWALTRWGVLPGTTAIWGTSPGAATVMIIMSESWGGDIRLVAVMQYLRIVCVVMVAALVARLWTSGSAGPTAEMMWFPAIAWRPLLATLAIAAAGAILAMRLAVPSGTILLPLAATMVLQATGTMTVELPPWLLAICYAVIGWSIGLRFTRPILVYALRALPLILASTLTLIAICGGIAGLLVVLAGIDPLTAYLATSPGGVDSIAIIAASSNVDMRFVMAMQTARLLVVLLTIPSIAEFIAKRAGGGKPM